MSAALLIARRELSGYLLTFSGYVIIAAMLGLDALMFNAWAIGEGAKRSAEVLSQFFWATFGTTVGGSIFISMRLLAEERQTGTLALLYSSPVKDSEIVLGKFFAGFAFLILFLAATTFMPALIFVNGKVSFGQIAAGYLGLVLVGSACLAIGVFGSALAKSQIIAAISSASMVVALLICWMLSRVTERPLKEIFKSLALYQDHFPPFQQGLIHLRDVVYYLALTYVALFAATRVLEARRWR